MSAWAQRKSESFTAKLAEERMLTVLQNGTGVTPEEMLHRMIMDVDFFVGDTPQHDDITLMLIKAL